jgi:hypothetical protein
MSCASIHELSLISALSLRMPGSSCQLAGNILGIYQQPGLAEIEAQQAADKEGL